MSDFDIRALIIEVDAATECPRTSVIAAKVLEAIPPQHYRDALAALLPIAVTQVLSQRRPRISLGGQNGLDTQVDEAAGAFVSRKVAQINSYDWRKALHCTIVTAYGKQRLGECSVADLEYTAAYRDQLADANRAQADNYRGLAKILIEHGVDKVRQLPEAVLAQVLPGITP